MAGVRRLASLIFVMVLVVTLFVGVTPTIMANQNSDEGSFDILIFSDGNWQSQGELSFRDYETLQLPLENDAGKLRLRLVQQGHDAAFVDYIAIQKDGITYPPILATNVDSGTDVLYKVLSPEYDVCDAWESILEIVWDNVPEKSMFVMRAMEEDLGEGHGAPLYHPCLKLGDTLSYTPVFDGGITVDGLLEESADPDFSVFWTPSSPHPDGYTYGWLHFDNEYLYAAVEVTADNTPDEEDWGAIYVMVNGELKEFRVSCNETDWGISGFQYTSSVPYEHRIYEFAIPLNEINAGIGSEVQYGFGCYGTVTQYDEVWVDDDYTDPNEDIDNDQYFFTIKGAIFGVQLGGTIHVAAGSYIEENVQINKPLSLLGAGCGSTFVSGNSANNIFFVNSSDVTISGFSIHGALWEGIYLSQAEDCHILDNCIYENEDGIYLVTSSNNTIRNNEIHHNGTNGIYFYIDSSNNLIEDNNIHHNYNQWSCPFLYSWDGSEYQLDSQLFAATKGTETYYDELEYPSSVDGKYLLKITEEMYETAYIDELKLTTIDHPAGTQAVVDRSGNIHTIRAPIAPTAGNEEDGTDCLDKVMNSDGIYWTSNMDNKDFSVDEDLRDGIILTFDKPADAETAKVVLKWKNTTLFEPVNRVMVGLPQDPSVAELRRFVTRPCLEVWNEGVIVSSQRVSSPGSAVDREDIQVIDISGIAGDKVTIKIESTTGLLMVDSVLVDFSVDETVYTTELPVVTAIDGNGADIVPQLLSNDDNYFVMEEGDFANLSFDEPAALADHDRSYLVKADGYYNSPFITDIASETRIDLLEQFLADPNYAMRYSLEKGLERDSHCGIYIGAEPTYDYDRNCDSNEIRGNDIYENTGDGIYLKYADETLIINNQIYSNEGAGVYFYNSRNCEIYCNDIYDNNPGNLSGIHLWGDSSNNVINFNNIYGNSEGVYNETSNTVDATNNWWGCSDGPGESGCDTIYGPVNYDDYSADRITDCPFDEEPTPTPTPTQPPETTYPVGGDVFTINKIMLIAPWIALAMVIVAGSIYLVRRRVHN